MRGGKGLLEMALKLLPAVVCPRAKAFEIVRLFGSEIISSDGMQLEKQFIQHGSVSVYAHSVAVAVMCVRLAMLLPFAVDLRALVRGALLHDYFLYDWHDGDKSHRLHGFRHARFAFNNAKRDFELGEVEKNMILSHMFPLGIVLPRFRESVILCIADKICATAETSVGCFAKFIMFVRM